MLATERQLERVVRDYKDTIWQIAVSITHNQHDAEDVFQDVFVRLVESIEKIHSEEHLRAWLIRVTVNRCYSWSKTAWKKRVSSYEKLHEEIGDYLEPARCDDYDGIQNSDFDPEMAQSLRGEKVFEVLQKMSKDNRIAVYLMYWENLSVKEIARLLKITESTVKTRLSRARKEIRESVENDA